jgi:excisionase family DNA binding protein
MDTQSKNLPKTSESQGGRKTRHHESGRAQRKGEVKPQRLAWPIDEGAHRMGVGRTSVYKLAAEGKLRLIKIAGRTLIPDSEIVRLAEGGGR